MATDLERLVVQLSADIKGYENGLRRAQGVTTRHISGIERSFARSNKNIAAGFGGLAKSFAAAFAGGVGLRGAQQLVDTATRVQNALKVAGLEGAELAKVYDRLFASAQRNSAPIESLVQLYGRLALSQKELGITQEELLGFTDKIGMALRVSGKSASEASGALLQMAQALGGGTVRAEEFNSMLEGAQPIVQAAANGIKEAGGSISKLRQLVIDGEVSSKAFFRGFEAGSADIERQAASSETTISGAFVRLQNVLVDTAGKLDEGTEASKNIGGALQWLSEVIEQTDWSGLTGNLGDFIREIDAALDKIEAFGQAIGADKVGDWIRGGTKADAAIQSRINGAFAGTIAPKGGRLGSPRTATDIGTIRPNRTPISLQDYAAPAGSSGSSGQSKADTNSFSNLSGGAIARYVEQVVKAESGGNASAKNPLSSATGLGQFISSTWLSLFKKNFPDRAKSMSDATILALRKDADISREMIEAYATDNAAILRQAGVSVNEAALHLAHFLGPGGAAKILTANPNASAESVLGGAAARANPTIIGGGRTVQDVINYGQRRATTAFSASVIEQREPMSGYTDSTTAADALLKKNQELQASYEGIAQVGLNAFKGIVDAMKDGKLEASELLDIVINVLEQIAAMPAINGAGGAGAAGVGGGAGGIIGLLGGLFGGFRAGGGNVSRGKAYVVGERRSELFVPGQSGTIIPNLRGGAGGGSTHVIRLVDDSGRMAQIADQQIQTRSGDIVRVSVQQGQRVTRRNFAGMQADTNLREF